MDAPQGEWRPSKGRYTSGDSYWLGRVKVGAAFYNGARSRNGPLAYHAEVLLPGVKFKDGTNAHSTIEDAKRQAEAAVGVWFNWLDEQQSQAA